MHLRTSLKTRHALAWQVLELLSYELDAQGSSFHSTNSLRKYDKVIHLLEPWFPSLSNGGSSYREGECCPTNHNP